MAFDVGDLYQRARNSHGFAVFLIVFCVGWITWNTIPGLPHFDDSDFGRLVTGLSIEASIGLSIYGAIQATWRRADEKFQRESETRDKQMASMQTAMLHMLESHTVLLKAIGGGDVARADAGAAADEGMGDA